MAKLVLQTKGGGIPYLNDTLLAKFNYSFLNVKFSEFLTNMDIFKRFAEEKKSNDVFKDLFNLDNVYLSLFCAKDCTLDLGCGDTNSIYVQCTNGKGKLTFEDYINSINLLNPKIAVVPYEHVSNYYEIIIIFI